MNFKIASVDNFKEYYVQNSLEKDIFHYAGLLLEGKFSVGYSSIPAIQYDITKIDQDFWHFRNNEMSNTYLLYAFGLRSVYILTRAYEKSNNLDYFLLASSFINSLYSYIFKSNKIDPFVHNDHVNAERVENLVYFGYVASKKKIRLKNLQTLYDLIVDCRDWLYADDKYQRNHNHGILADKGLIIAASSTKDKTTRKMIDHAIFRLKGQIAYAYGSDFVHLENSFDYHIAITNQIRAIYNCLLFIKHPYNNELKSFLEKTYDFLVYAYKPNLQRPLFGDSKGKRTNAPDNVEASENLNLLYIKTQGEHGKKPKNNVSFYPDAGYVFLRNHFEKENYKNATWISLKAGFKSRIHKHQDDLSVCFYSQGHDIFVDAGMYNFMHGDKINYYMESVAAHTTIGLHETPYSIARGNGELTVIQKVIHKENYDYILASSRIYEDCAIYRHLFYFRDKDVLVIYDEIYSRSDKKFVQYFHLSPELKTLSVHKDRSVFQIGDSEFIAVIKQLDSVKELNILSGNKTSPISVLSTGFSEYVESESLQYMKEGKKVRFVCAVEIKPAGLNKGNQPDLTALSDEKLLVSDLELPLPSHSPVEYQGSDFKISNKTLTISNSQSTDENLKFSLYIYDHKSKKIVEKLPYTTAPFLEYTFTTPGEYDLLYYVSNNFREKIKGILATVVVSDYLITIRKKYQNLYRPIVRDVKAIKKLGSKYKFIIPIQYDFPFTCNWWIYCDGMNIQHKTISNDNKFTYQFLKPGNYVIMCSVSDPYFGEFYFSKNTAIQIQ